MVNHHISRNRIRKSYIVLLLIAVFSLLLSGCGAAAAKPKVYRVGILSGLDPFVGIADGFKAKMAELGYIEGQNIVYDLQKVNSDPAEERRIIQKFVTDKVDLMLVFPTDPALAAKAATEENQIPVLFANSGIEGNDLVKSVREPGGNITGIRFPGPETTVKRLEFLLKVAPEVKRLWVTYDKNYPNTAPALEALRPAAEAAGVTVVEVPVTTVADIQADLQARDKLADIGLDAILIMPELLSQSPDAWSAISQFAAKHKVPIAGAAAFTADQGAIFSYTPGTVEQGHSAALMADKIFKGTSAGTIPVLSPDSALRLNYKTAQGLGLTIPEGLLRQAAEIIR